MTRLSIGRWINEQISGVRVAVTFAFGVFLIPFSFFHVLPAGYKDCNRYNTADYPKSGG